MRALRLDTSKTSQDIVCLSSLSRSYSRVTAIEQGLLYPNFQTCFCLHTRILFNLSSSTGAASSLIYTVLIPSLHLDYPSYSRAS